MSCYLHNYSIRFTHRNYLYKHIYSQLKIINSFIMRRLAPGLWRLTHTHTHSPLMTVTVVSEVLAVSLTQALHTMTVLH